MKTIKKLVTISIILVLCVTVLAGCKENHDNSQTTTPTLGKSTEVSTGTSTGTSADNSAVIKQGTIPKSGNVILKELAFVYNDNTVAISDIVDDEKLESILGKAKEIKSHTYSKDDGKNMDTLIGFTEKQYKFPGIEIKTIKAPTEENFTVFQIIITDSSYSTKRNIKVGDSVKKLKEVYTEGNMLGDGAEDDFQYLPVNYVDAMKFHVKDGKIQNIMMYKLLD